VDFTCTGQDRYDGSGLFWAVSAKFYYCVECKAFGQKVTEKVTQIKMAYRIYLQAIVFVGVPWSKHFERYRALR